MIQKVDETKRKEIADKVQKLLALGTDTRANPNEAASAMRMADALMRRYGLEHSDVILDELKHGDGVDSEIVEGAPKTGAWVGVLAVATARLFDCEVRRRQPGQHRFMGYAADLQMATWTFRYLLDAISRGADRYAAGLPPYMSVRTAKNAFRSGMAMQLKDMLKAALADKQLADRQHSTSTALVVAKRQAIAQSFGPTTYNNVKIRTSDGTAYAEGREAGRGVNIRPNVIGGNGSTQPGRLLK